jgi:hypothetical protein
VPATADAQEPVCPPDSGDKMYRTTCRPDLRFGVVRFLSDFTVDHLFKPSPPRIRRTPAELLAPFVGDTVAANEDLRDHVGSIDDFRFTQLDTATGVFYADIDEDTRTFSSVLSSVEELSSFRIELPERLEGGYWRTPGALQLAFWKGKRVGFFARTAQEESLQGSIACVAISADRLRIELADESMPGIIVEMSECE